MRGGNTVSPHGINLFEPFCVVTFGSTSLSIAVESHLVAVSGMIAQVWLEAGSMAFPPSRDI